MATETLEAGQAIKAFLDGEWLYGVIERINGRVAIVQWNDGENTQIYLDRLERAYPYPQERDA